LLGKIGEKAQAANEVATITRLEQQEHADELANPKLPSPEIREQN